MFKSIISGFPLIIAVTYAVCSDNCADCPIGDQTSCESSEVGCVFTGLTNANLHCMSTSEFFLGPVSTRSAAQSYCNSKGSQLATFHSYEDWQDGRAICEGLGNALTNDIAQYVTGQVYGGCWTGLSRVSDGGCPGGEGACSTPFHWDDASSLDYGFDPIGDGRFPHENLAGSEDGPWHPSNPNSFGGTCFGFTPCMETCVHLLERFLAPPDNFRWHDVDCRYENFALCNPIPCDDAISCTIDILNTDTGLCEHIPTTEICTDGGECSRVSCDINAQGGTDGCVYTDSNALCLDVDDIATNKCRCPQCSEGECSTDVIDCTDNDPCTTDDCDPTRGCINYYLAEGEECSDSCQCLNELICIDESCQQPTMSPSGDSASSLE